MQDDGSQEISKLLNEITELMENSTKNQVAEFQDKLKLLIKTFTYIK